MDIPIKTMRMTLRTLMESLFEAFFPEYSPNPYEQAVNEAVKALSSLCGPEKAERFRARIPFLAELLAQDVEAIGGNDPAACDIQEIVYCYPAVTALVHYRVAHELDALGVGIIPRIEQFTHAHRQINLAVSLHAPSNTIRDKIIPANKKYPLDDLLEACRQYTEKTGRRITFEYALIHGLNDNYENAVLLSKRLKGMLCHVNLIPLNPVPERNLRGVTRTRAAEFCALLNRLGTSATVRREMGTDIEGACGQLRKSHMDLRG